MTRFRAVFASITLALLLALPAGAQAPYAARNAVLASNFDLDGEAADADQVVTVVVVTDSLAFTIAADPDVCRLVDVTVTDANSTITVGTLTINGFDCWGYPLRVTYNMAGGSGVRTGTVAAAGVGNVIRASGAYFSDVTDASVGVLTGEEAVVDTVTIGYTSNSVAGYPLYGRYTSTPSGRRWVDIFGTYAVPVLISILDVDASAVAASTTAPFENVSVGDLFIVNVNGEMFTRLVTTKTDNDNIILSSGIPTVASTAFSYKKRFFSTDPQDGWIPVSGFDTVVFAFEVDVNANTGGVISNIECATFATSDPPGSEVEVQVDTATVASGAAGEDVTTVDLRLTPHYTHCRAGMKFGTGDDADAAAENVDLVIGLRK